ncbi:MAG: amidohydrolase family protein [Armatimonadota bacterium]|nr:amidohydrolase family protein [Armatimonadota bacterium]
MTTRDLILRGARTLGAPETVDIAIVDGYIAAVGPNHDAGETLELDGRLVLPAFVDSHVHLDKAFLWDSPLMHGRRGPDVLRALRTFKSRAHKDDLERRMQRALELATHSGTTAMRVQVDVDDVIGLIGLEVALELRRRWADRLRIQIVAFPQEGLLGRPGLMPLLRQALASGADAVGGGPTFDSVAPGEHLAAVFELAREFDRDVDLHVDLNTPPSRPPHQWEVAEVARLTRAIGWEGRVTVAHMRGLGAMAPEALGSLLGVMQDVGINVTIVPGAELHIARTWWDPPVREVSRAMTNLDALLQAGITTSYATGHVRDPWNPHGSANMLLDAFLLTASYNMGEPVISGIPVLRLGTDLPWRSLRLPGPSNLAVGREADLVVLDARDHDAAVRAPVEPFLVLKGGHIVGGSARRGPDRAAHSVQVPDRRS